MLLQALIGVLCPPAPRPLLLGDIPYLTSLAEILVD